MKVSNAFEALATADECTDVRKVSEWEEILEDLELNLCKEVQESPKVPEVPREGRRSRKVVNVKFKEQGN